MSPRRLSTLAALTALSAFTSACSDSQADALAAVRTDTLPGGVISVVSEGATAWRGNEGWQLLRDGTLDGGVGMPGELIDPQSIAVDSRGYVYVADQSPAVVKVYDTEGRYVRSFGREGEGPGEFKVAFLDARGGKILVHDPRAARASLFDTAGTFIRSWSTSCCYWSQPSLDATGHVRVPSMTNPEMKVDAAYLRFDTLGTPVDTVKIPELEEEALTWQLSQGKTMRMMTIVPFSPRSVNVLTPDGGVIRGWSGEYRLVQSSNGQDTVRVFGRDWTADPIPEERRNDIWNKRVEDIAKSWKMDRIEIERQFEKSKIPTEAPAYEWAAVDPAGTVWVMTGSSADSTSFDVFNREGVYLGPVRAEGVIPAFGSAWSEDAMYVRSENDEGYPEIVRYRIVRNRGKS